MTSPLGDVSRVVPKLYSADLRDLRGQSRAQGSPTVIASVTGTFVEVLLRVKHIFCLI